MKERKIERLADPDRERPASPIAARRRRVRPRPVYRFAPAPKGADPVKGEAAIRAYLRRFCP